MMKVSNYILKKKVKNSFDKMNPFSEKKKDKKKKKDKSKQKEKKKEKDKKEKIKLSEKLSQKEKKGKKNQQTEDKTIQEDGKTKCCNVVACCCSCNFWCTGCCSWYCIYTVWDIAVKQCNKSHGVRLILLLLCFCFTPFLCCVGLINCLMGCGTVIEKVKEFCKKENVLLGYKQIIIPEESGPFIQKSEYFLDDCFTC